MASNRTRVLLGSGGISTESRRQLYRELVSDHFSDCEEVLFVPYASDDHRGYTRRMRGALWGDGPSLVGIEEKEDPLDAIRAAEAIYVGGGNSFLLVRELHRMGLVEAISTRVSEGAPYLGVSAGANVASPTMMTTNDMPIALPPSFESMGVVPFQINPHYHPGKIRFMVGGELMEHYGESRAQRISEYHKQFSTPVLGMWEGSFVRWDGSLAALFGRATAFRPGDEPIDLEDGCHFDGSLRVM